MIPAILRAQLLSMWPRRVRGGAGLLGVGAGAIAAAAMLLVWSAVAWGAFLFFSSEEQTVWFRPVLSAGLMFVMLYWQLAPVVSASFGASIDLRKLLGYPIPVETLFRVEVLLRTTTCWEMPVVLAGVVAGLLANSLFGWRAAPRILPAVILFAAANVLISAGTRSWLERVMAKRRIREVMAFALVGLSLLPQLFVNRRPPSWLRPFLAKALPTSPAWPWGAASNWMLGEAVWFAAVCALVWVGAAYAFGRWQFVRGLRFEGASESDGTAGTEAGASGVGWVERLFRFPSALLPDPVGALVEKELRVWSRLPRFRLLFPMACAFGPVFFSRFGSRRGGMPPEILVPLMATYGLLQLGQATFWNSFGFDRAAVQGYFSWPVRFRDVLVAKNIALVAIMPPMVFLVAGLSRLLGVRVSVATVAECCVTVPVAALYWCALGNLVSVHYPAPMRTSAMGRTGARVQSLALLGAPLFLFPLALAYWARWSLENELLFWGIVVVAALVGGMFYWVALDSAAAAGSAGREKIMEVLATGDGPVSTS